MKTVPAQETIRILKENEIQERLYGAYQRPCSKPSVTATSSDSDWTGSQILMGEVQRLRSELICLRKEKDRLASQLERLHPEPVRSVSPIGGWFGHLFGSLCLAAIMGYLLSARMLQASPPVSLESTPYTVQVAVYDGPLMAHRTESFLKELGYNAFLVENARRDGQVHYRIYVGSFVTKDEARMEKARLTADPRFQSFKDAFVRVR